MKQISYEYHNLPIPGGGYVTGFLFDPDRKDVLYARTDIGGCYRFSYPEQKWHCLSESVNMFDLSETYPIAIAVDQTSRETLYVVSGVNEEGRHGKFSISMDGGQTFVHKTIPCFVHGNLNGRGTGYRLVQNPADPGTLYFASQKDGLLISRDQGTTWEKTDICGEKYLTLVWCAPNGHTLVVGTAGISTGNEQLRGHSLYVSYDEGAHFEPLPMPENNILAGSKWSGFVAHRYDYDGKYLYCTLNHTGEYAYIVDMGYSCDCGDVLGGRVLRYEFDDAGRICSYTDITPMEYALKTPDGNASRERYADGTVLSYGFGGICSSPVKEGMLVLSTICRGEGDMVFWSKDYGATWEIALYDLAIGNLHFKTSYMKPEFNGQESLLHWLSDIKINPFDPDEVWFNSGTGVFVCHDFLSEQRSFTDCCTGIEETVHLNIYSPVAGPVKVLDILGDLGGFAFKEPDQPCENSFADAEGNRYITCINADFSDLYPEYVIVTPRGNWKGKTKGGLILSKDYGQTFERLSLPFGISSYLDERFHDIERPNVNSGWVALSADAETICYGVAEGIDLFMKGIIVSHDQGRSFHKSHIYGYVSGVAAECDAMEAPADEWLAQEACVYEDQTDRTMHLKIYSDRVAPNVFYGFGDDFTVYLSTDAGDTFYQISHALCPNTVLGLIDCANKTELRADSGKEGIFYCALGEHGLYKLKIDAQTKELSFRQITGEADSVFRMGLGVLPGKDYLTDDKALYICGILSGEYGFFRSFDDGRTWEKLNTEAQQFGDINSMDGDSREPYVFYIATGSFGVKYGRPSEI